MCGMMQWAYEWLQMLVRAVMPSVPRCVRCMFVIPSGPAAEDALSDEMTLMVCVVVKGAMVWSSFVL